MELKDVVERLGQDFTIEVIVLDGEKEVEVVGLDFVLIVPFSNDAHNFADSFDLLD